MGSNHQTAGTRDSSGVTRSPAWNSAFGVSALAVAPVLVLASILTFELLPPIAPADRNPSIAPQVTLPSRQAAARPIDTWVDTARARPLFSPARRPSSNAASPDGPLPRLAGTIKSGSEMVALFAPDAAARLVAVRRDADIAGWTVVDIANDAVVLARDGQRVRLGLAFADRPVSAQPLQATSAEAPTRSVVTDLRHTAPMSPAKAAEMDPTR